MKRLTRASKQEDTPTGFTSYSGVGESVKDTPPPAKKLRP